MRKLNIISILISILITAICIGIYFKRIFLFVAVPIIALSTMILFIMFGIVLQKYIYLILKQFFSKKIISSLLLTLLLITSLAGLAFISNNINYILRNIILMFIYIIGVVCLPLIILGISVLFEGKLKKIVVFISVVLLIFIYYANSSLVFECAKEIISNMYIGQELFTMKEEKFDFSYLENYRQKMGGDGYISKWDVIQIIDISDKKSKEITINYKDEQQNINLSISNKNDYEIENLKNLLKYDFYKFEYDLNNSITINIERYVIEQNQNKEKNSNIILSGNKSLKIIELKNKYCSENKENFLYENNVNSNSSEKINSLKLLFLYDKENDNYVPIVSDENRLENIINYKVYQSGLEITIPKETELESLDYTLRINRYDDNLQIKKVNSYYYEYEPLVTQMQSNLGTVLEIRFNRSYTLNELKNIEIIFGKNK